MTSSLNENGNFGATVEEIRATLDESSSVATKRRIQLEVCKTIERHRTERFDWMLVHFQLKLVPGKRMYALRDDFDRRLRAIQGDECWVWENGLDTMSHVVQRRSPQLVERQSTTTQYRGQPKTYAIEGRQLILDPVPNSSTADILVGRGILAVEPPVRKWSGTVWEFSPDSFTNEWFTEGASLVDAYTRYKLLAGPLKRPEEASIAAGEYEEIRKVMRLETDEDAGAVPIDPWVFC